MSKHYRDYVWKDGIPYGREVLDESAILAGISFKIPMDPYRKRISIEQYNRGEFGKIIYDSALFNFRHLKPAEQNAWQKSVIKETDDYTECLIRNQDDRIVLHECYTFEQGRCRECKAYSPQGILISTQRIFYKALGDAFDGVILYDSNDHPVLTKKYIVDSITGEFTDLLEEVWDMK